MNLEQLRKQAKELLKQAKAGNDEAVGRLGGREPILANARLVLAREHGYPSWPALVTAAEADEAIIRSAMRGNLEATIEALGPDFHGVSDGSPDGTLLHHAAWYGDGEGVRTLLARGARVQHDPDGETPLEWAVWSSRHIQRFGLEYVPVAEALVEHGEEIEPRYLDIALGPLREWLELRLSGEL